MPHESERVGLTVPIVAVSAVLPDLPVTSGLSPKVMALLTPSFVVASLPLGEFS